MAVRLSFIKFSTILIFIFIGETMAKIGYFATYARFDTVDKEAAAAFLGADNIVGDTFTVDHEITPDSNKAWIVNPFGKKMGYLSPKVAEQVDLCKAKGWNTVAILALVAFSEQPEPGLYWGEVVIISYDPAYESAFSTFVEGIRKQISKGVRPKVKLGPDSLQKIIDTQALGFLAIVLLYLKKKKGPLGLKLNVPAPKHLLSKQEKVI